MFANVNYQAVNFTATPCPYQPWMWKLKLPGGRFLAVCTAEWNHVGL